MFDSLARWGLSSELQHKCPIICGLLILRMHTGNHSEQPLQALKMGTIGRKLKLCHDGVDTNPPI